MGKEIKKSISLVLSSGGARGVAHIGVIEELEKQGYEIKSVAGTSMGALIGGIYASGKLEEYKDWICSLDKLDVFKLIDFTFSANGLVKGDRVFKEMHKFIPDVNIEDLQIPFAAVATDIVNEKEIVFTKGSLFDAVRASIAIPTIFTPKHKDGLQLVDGGILNPIPVNRVKRYENDILVVVNVNARIPYKKSVIPKEKGKLNKLLYNKRIKSFEKRLSEIIPKHKRDKLGYFKLLSATTNLMLYQISMMSLEQYSPDMLINISRKSFGTYDFYKAKEMIETGKTAARLSIKEFKMLNNKKIKSSS
ncbi:MAG: patatin-like phospholipase family protein [Bacteroidales bacterium]|nr:patatin-like phospholipase family protein [Bacteroidales bacterium]